MSYGPRLRHGGYVGGREHPLHYTWRSMLARCHNPNNASFRHYGGRGITVCEAWHDFKTFAASVGPRPSAAHSLDRIDVHVGYQPGNVRWATRSEQQKNKTTTRKWESGGFVGTLTEWAARTGVSKPLALWRIKNWGTFIKGETCQLVSTR